MISRHRHFQIMSLVKTVSLTSRRGQGHISRHRIVQRKSLVKFAAFGRMGVDNGRPARALFSVIGAFISEQSASEMTEFIKPLKSGLDDLMAVAMWLAQNAIQRHEEAGAASVDFLRLMGTVAVGFMWARMARTSLSKLSEGTDDMAFHKMKLNTARYYMGRVMPDTASLKTRAMAGADVLMMPDDEAF